MKRDFLTLSDLSLEEHKALMHRSHALKAARREHRVVKTLEAVSYTHLDVYKRQLLKGAAGQALQNFNLLAGFPETEGLL